MSRKYTVGEFKARFSEALQAVEEGDTVAITYGRAKRTVALLTPPPKPETQARKLGRFAGKFTATISDDWKLDDKSFLES
ncbi:MAG: type II toxin-antitoxin system Phd/YefM family antitoxin [Lentimonas sp.]